MIKKRSVGVGVFGYFGLILGIFGVIEELLKMPNIDLIKILIGFAFIFLSYNLLKLKNWSRVLLLILNGVVVLIVTIAAGIILFGLPWKEVVEIFKKIYPHFTIIAFIMFLVAHIYFYGFLIFFTRPRVKERFK